MPRTAWSASGSLPSDRFRSATAPKARSSTPKKEIDSSKSLAVLALEDLLHGLRQPNAGVKQDPDGGCFCNARHHSVSNYTPVCRQCGLVLCELNPPHRACPHCASALFSPAEQAALATQLESEIESTVVAEKLARERAAEQVRQAAGQFPTLPDALPAPAVHPPQERKVISLNSKTKKVTVAKYAAAPMPSRPPSAMENAPSLGIRRVPPPAVEVQPLRVPSATYIPRTT